MKKLNALDILCSFSLTVLSLASLQRSYNVGRMAHKLSFNGKPIPSDPPTTVSNTGLETYPTGDLTSRGGSRIFFRRGSTRLLLYFNTNKPHSFFT